MTVMDQSPRLYVNINMACICLPAGLHRVDFVHEMGQELETSVYTLRAAALVYDDTKLLHLSPARGCFIFSCFYGLIQLQMAPFILHTNE